MPKPATSTTVSDDLLAWGREMLKKHPTPPKRGDKYAQLRPLVKLFAEAGRTSVWITQQIRSRPEFSGLGEGALYRWVTRQVNRLH